MATATKINRGTFYDMEWLELEAGLRYSSIQRARKDGRLRFTRQGGKILFRGDWVEDWLTGAEQPAPSRSAGA